MKDFAYQETEGLKFHFEYTDTFNQTTTLTKTMADCVLDDADELTIIIEQFNRFLNSCGFSKQN